MAGRSSNWDRIERMAAEAEATRKEKATTAEKKKTVKAKKTTRTTGVRKTAAKSRPSGRIKVVWTLCDQAGRGLKTVPYAEEDSVRAEAKALTESTSKPHFVRRDEVPFED